MRCACVVTVASIIITYGFATSQKTIKSDVFPIISETFMGKPQSYVSEFALSFASWVLLTQVWIVRRFMERYATNDSDKWRKHASRSAVVGYIASICLGLTAAINYGESFGAHVTAAFGFLFALWIWLACVVAQLTKHEGAVSRWSARAKAAGLALAGLGVGGFTALSALVGKDESRTAYSLIGFCEWLAVLALVAACYTMAWDLDAKGVSIRVCFDEESPPRSEQPA